MTAMRQPLRTLWELGARHAPANAVRVWCQRRKGVSVGRNVYLGYDVTIDPALPWMVTIEDHARIGHGVIILAHSRPADAWMAYLGEYRAPVVIGRHAAVYAGAIVMPGVTVRSYSIVRAGAVVEEDVDDCAVVGGVPARVVEMLPPEKLDDPVPLERNTPMTR